MVKLIKKNIPLAEIENLVAIIGEIALYIPGAYEATYLDDIDPDDNMFLVAAYESNADYLVTLDKKHLLPLKHYHETQILSPALLIRQLNSDM